MAAGMTLSEATRFAPAPDGKRARAAVSGRWLVAVGVSAVVVLTSPFVADVRDALRRASGSHYGMLINGIVLGAVAFAAVAALGRIRYRRSLRYGALVAAIGAGAAYVWATALPGVERFHFVEYGLLTFLFYRATVPGPDRAAPATGDVSLVVVPTLAALMVGTADEWVQWFVPRRYGEVRDIFLNLAAIGCGLLFSFGAEPPPAWRLRPTPESVARMARLAAAAVLGLGVFLYSVHLGHWIVDGEIGAFRSRHTAAQLRDLAADRAARWGGGGPPDVRAFAREDHYLTEGIWHVQRRNEAWANREIDTAWRENLILERYFAPVLRAGHAWPAAQRAGAARERPSEAGWGFVSRAERYPILIWPGAVFITLVFAAVFALLAISFTSSRIGSTSSRWC